MSRQFFSPLNESKQSDKFKILMVGTSLRVSAIIEK